MTSSLYNVPLKLDDYVASFDDDLTEAAFSLRLEELLQVGLTDRRGEVAVLAGCRIWQKLNLTLR